jgi:hypothetical protein
VIRVEWEIKPGEGNFQEDLRDFSLFNGFSIKELSNYLLDNWGRLCIPNPKDSNRRRWQETQFWEQLREVVTLWSKDVSWPTSRLGKSFHGISDAYIKQLSGTISGGMARLSPNNLSFEGLAMGLDEFDENKVKIGKKAAEKAAIYSRL